jgi:hypothetical protein
MDYQGSIWSGFNNLNRVSPQIYFAIENNNSSKIENGGVLRCRKHVVTPAVQALTLRSVVF